MKRTRDRERGQVVVTSALLLTVMVGFAALATDIGFLYSSRTGGQAVADGAALAGAASFIYSPYAPQPATAQNRAVATAVAQDVLADTVQASEVSVNVDVPNQLVTVSLNRNEETFFSGVMGIDQATIGTVATAEASTVAAGSRCTKPFFLPNSILIDISPCDGLHGQARSDCIKSTTCGECSSPGQNSSLLVYQDPYTGEYKVTPWARSLLPQQVNLRPTDPSSALTPGGFYSVRLGDSTGGNDYRTNIRDCAGEITYCGFCYTVEPGNMVGPTDQGMTDLLHDPPHQMFTLASGEYCYGSSLDNCTLNGSRQLVSVPVWDICGAPAAACPAESFCADRNGDGVPDTSFSGTPVLRIVAYAMILIEDRTGSTVTAQLIDIKPCSAGGGTAQETGPMGVPLRLVTLPPAGG